MEKDINIEEFEMMKKQLDVLKDKLDKETIINEQLMRRAMKEDVSRLHKDAIIICCVALLGIPYCTWIFSHFNLSDLFIGVTDVFLVVAIIYTYITHKGLNANDLLDGNLVDVSYKITKIRRLGALWLRLSIPFIIIWFAWFLFETLKQNAEEVRSMAYGGIVGGIIGTILGTIKYRKNRKKTQEILLQIKELTGKELSIQ
ncbi:MULTISPECIES: hypothetical protein [Prevotella]|uniref:RDD family protein n=1 Tax=Prevotella herbatica TaxID=2801997 RepID=A0ABN6EKK6_9BACT|nr:MULTISPECIES: hypothetical protein [Prevotella]MDN5553369.1 hypothetical protein [Prevotella sp.]BCS85889.1 hypothetical protein prwr041_17820 [Prevotella herbatica]